MSNLISLTAVLAAQKAAAEFRVPASVSLAQYVVESGAGRHEPLGSNNPFGIQSAKGQPFVEARTTEFRHGRFVSVTEKFRVFGSLEEAFQEHARLLATAPAYRRAMQLADNPDKFAKALTGIYATAPHYGETLVSVMRQYNLYQYDVAPLAAPAGIESPADGRLVAVVSSSVHGIAQLGTMAGMRPLHASSSRCAAPPIRRRSPP
jgi:flagellum-specific peptidoglycan hydrolase FlgJ